MLFRSQSPAGHGALAHGTSRQKRLEQVGGTRGPVKLAIAAGEDVLCLAGVVNDDVGRGKGSEEHLGDRGVEVACQREDHGRELHALPGFGLEQTHVAEEMVGSIFVVGDSGEGGWVELAVDGVEGCEEDGGRGRHVGVQGWERRCRYPRRLH